MAPSPRSMIRFETAADVVAAFPMLLPFLPEKPDQELPLEFLAQLTAADNPYGAPAFAAHLLPRRECVEFLCAAFQACVPAPVPAGDPDMALVINWARKPDESVRQAALARADMLDPAEPVAWALRAVGWSGGNILTDVTLPPVHAPIALTPQAVASALALALAKVPPEKVRDTVRLWTEACIRIAQSDAG